MIAAKSGSMPGSQEIGGAPSVGAPTVGSGGEAVGASATSARQAARAQLVQGEPERVEVALRGRGSAAEQLGRHVAAACPRAAACQRTARRRPRSKRSARPKSSSFTSPPSVTRALEGLMSRWSTPWRWAAASPRARPQPQRRAPPPGQGQGQLREALADHVLRDDVGVSAHRADAEHGDDVGVLQAGDGARLGLEVLADQGPRLLRRR